jgi:hypothetical protein
VILIKAGFNPELKSTMDFSCLELARDLKDE